MVNSRSKGKRGELEACRLLRSIGVPAERSVQYQGAGSAGDLVIPGARVHPEVKVRRAIQFHRHWDQAVRDARTGFVPFVMSHEDRGEWLITTRVVLVCELARQLMAAADAWARERGQ